MYLFLLILLLYMFFLALFLNKKYEILNQVLVIFLMTFLTLMIGFRYGVGIDYFSYEEWFHLWYENITYEWIYSLLVFFFKTTTGEFYYLTLFMALITNFFIYKGLTKRNIKNIYLVFAIMIFMSSSLFVFANIMRQGLVVAIFFYCSIFIKERKKWRYFFWILIGSGFHLSILFLLPFYYLHRINIKFKYYVFLLLMSYLLVYIEFTKNIFQYIGGFSPYASKYSEATALFESEVSLLSIGVLLKVLISIVLLFFYQKENDKFIIEKNYYQLGVIFNILSISTFMYGRIGIYFQVFEILMIPILISKVQNKNLRIIIFGASLFLIILLIINGLILNPEEKNLDYKSIFNDI